MGFIKNFEQLASTPERKVVLELIETAFAAIQPQEVMKNNISLDGDVLTVQGKTFDLTHYNRIFLLGFGKGSAGNAYLIEQLLGQRITEGYVIDTEAPPFTKVQFTKGTHPLISIENVKFTEAVVDRFTQLQLTEKDLVLIVICGGGSAMFEKMHSISFDQKLTIDKELLHSGANITEMNIVRKHLSAVKGGGLARTLFPSTVLTLVYSDVPGNDLSTIASGPTSKDVTTIDDAHAVITKYQLSEKIAITDADFVETPKEEKYFANVHPFIVLSNRTALSAMQAKAKELGYVAEMYSDKFQSEAHVAGKKLLDDTPEHFIHLVGGETTVKVTGHGRGGRNQELILGALPHLDESTVIASFDSDGWDFDTYAGAIGDTHTLQKATEKGLSLQEYLQQNNSLAFFEQVGDAIDTGRLPSNVSDLMIVMKK